MSDYKCNLIIPGAAKSGTSTLHDLIALHPNICMSYSKEPQHFSFDELYQYGAAEHNTLFESSLHMNYYGESSQSYFVHEKAIERIREDLKKPRIILLLRHPIDRLISHYAWRFKLGIERSRLIDAVKERGWYTGFDRDKEGGIYRARGGYLAFSQYSKHVPRWTNAFGAENVLVLTTDELKSSQTRTASRCFAFLGLPVFEVDEIESRNTTQGTSRQRLPLAIGIGTRALPLGFRRWIRARSYYPALRSAISRSFKRIPDTQLREDEMKFLLDVLAEDIAVFERYKSASMQHLQTRDKLSRTCTS